MTDHALDPNTDEERFAPMPRWVKIVLGGVVLTFVVAFVGIFLGQFVSEKEEIEFVRAVEQAVSEGDVDALNSRIDWERIAEKRRGDYKMRMRHVNSFDS